MSASFYERVYQVVRLIPPGKVVTYGQIARLLGEPHGARTVGWAMQALPDPEVPWHRVINAQGRISGVGRGARADLQRALLEDEGVVFDARGRVDLSVYQWEGPAPAIGESA
jgi:methylated-DNA-protein-cysteine methyltransferase-like protein